MTVVSYLRKTLLPTCLRAKPVGEIETLATICCAVKKNVKKIATAPGHLYVIKEREFIKTNENIFKIGKTTSIKHRMPAYPKDSRVYLIVFCPWDIHIAEKELIAHFDSIYKNRDDIGREYYEIPSGDHIPLIREFLSIMTNHL